MREAATTWIGTLAPVRLLLVCAIFSLLPLLAMHSIYNYNATDAFDILNEVFDPLCRCKVLLFEVVADGSSFAAETCVCVMRFASSSVRFTAMIFGFQVWHHIVPWCVVVVPLHALGVVFLTCLQVAAVGSTFPAETCVCVMRFASSSVRFTAMIFGFQIWHHIVPWCVVVVPLHALGVVFLAPRTP